MTDRRHSSNAHGSSFLQGSSNISITGGKMVGTQNYTTNITASSPLNLLYEEVAHNAILNAGGRVDEVRCHPGTREEVLSKAKLWRDDGPERMFWLTGPAGAGKTAIVQTFAEEYITSALIMINFFFFRSDPTRNHLAPIVATLIFQLLEFYPGAEIHITAVLAKMPYIFRKSIRDQFIHLIINPINALRKIHNDTRPVVILIDGLDECGNEPEAQQVQARLVQILHDLVSTPASPFIALVSSRPEAHLIRAFNAIENQYSSIFLDDQYRPSDDIRTYLTAEFAKIKRTHNLRHTIDAQWPSLDDIEEIVGKSSGQFIYAATVIRYLFSSPASPTRSLDQIKGIRPAKRNSPFAALDAVYIYILAQADDWDDLKDVLSLNIVSNTSQVQFIPEIQLLGYTEDDVIMHTANLGALMKFSGYNLIFYHASLVDFLTNSTRSGHLFLDIPAFTTGLVAVHFSKKVHHDGVDLARTLDIAGRVTISSPALEDALALFSPPDLAYNFKHHGDSCGMFLNMLNRMYSESNERFYEALLRKWLAFFYNNYCCIDKFKFAKIKLGFKIWADITRELPRSEMGRLEMGLQSETGQSPSRKHRLSPDPADLILHTRQRARHGDHPQG